ncbi:hypothetical protein CLV58_13144 [Spirosoma oryzae]|uniref:Lipoprotein n=1 Tax=Spirosoma oryzae TaxID=1469603 RepID=A0A2T0S312_9BACT|nr:hypothetical protein CLV58_13144 [Spirosoma oryzae]
MSFVKNLLMGSLLVGLLSSCQVDHLSVQTDFPFTISNETLPDRPI